MRIGIKRGLQRQSQRSGENESAGFRRQHRIDARVRDNAPPAHRWQYWNASGAAKRGVMSRNRMPGLGKSGIERMYRFRSRAAFMGPSYQPPVLPQPLAAPPLGAGLAGAFWTGAVPGLEAEPAFSPGVLSTP